MGEPWPPSARRSDGSKTQHERKEGKEKEEEYNVSPSSFSGALSIEKKTKNKNESAVSPSSLCVLSRHALGTPRGSTQPVGNATTSYIPLKGIGFLPPLFLLALYPGSTAPQEGKGV